MNRAATIPPCLNRLAAAVLALLAIIGCGNTTPITGEGGGTGGGAAGGSAGGGAAGGSGGGFAPGADAGSIGIDGGAVDHLFFAVVGDSRPNDIDVVSEYPTPYITKIYQDMEAMSPRPQFVVATGDYMYANTTTNTAQPQAALYMQARAAYSGALFPAMGNHECNGYTADNCVLGQTQNIQAFANTILAPSGQTNPYYSIPIRANNGGWNAKLVVIACNAWSTTQESWLTSTLAQPTTYTILVRHEPAEANTGPCVTTVENIMKTSAYDLSLVGHTHLFKGSASSKEIVIGNGGAPLSGGTYGYTTVERVPTGWLINNIDYSTSLPVQTYRIP
jgi:hypothetical protein